MITLGFSMQRYWPTRDLAAGGIMQSVWVQIGTGLGQRGSTEWTRITLDKTWDGIMPFVRQFWLYWSSGAPSCNGLRCVYGF